MRRNGFTLIEMLVTIGILGLAAAVVVPSLQGIESRRLQEEVARLRALFRIAQDEARVSGRTLVWEADLQGYRFRPLVPETAPEAGREWRDELLRARSWPFAVRRVEGGRIVFGREPMLEPATVRIATPERELRFALDALGNLRLADCEGARCAASR
jgi:type II secretion system protein H